LGIRWHHSKARPKINSLSPEPRILASLEKSEKVRLLRDAGGGRSEERKETFGKADAQADPLSPYFPELRLMISTEF